MFSLCARARARFVSKNLCHDQEFEHEIQRTCFAVNLFRLQAQYYADSLSPTSKRTSFKFHNTWGGEVAIALCRRWLATLSVSICLVLGLGEPMPIVNQLLATNLAPRDGSANRITPCSSRACSIRARYLPREGLLWWRRSQKRIWRSSTPRAAPRARWIRPASTRAARSWRPVIRLEEGWLTYGCDAIKLRRPFYFRCDYIKLLRFRKA